MNKFIDMLQDKMEIARSDSDFSFFFSLLVTGEALTKIITLLSIASLNEDKDRQRYRALHSLVRTSGIGEWSKTIDEVLIGTTSQHLATEFRPYQADLTKKTQEHEWQHMAVLELVKTLNVFGIKNDIPKSKIELKLWFKLFTELRNKTRGHGVMSSDKASEAAPYLDKSLQLIIEHSTLLKIPTAYVKRNLSGKYRVTPISVLNNEFDDLKTSTKFQIENGIYIFLSTYREVPLIISDADLDDFYIANGSFTNTKYELISYKSDDKKIGDSSEYLVPNGQLPTSESEGIGELMAIGNCLTNVPSLSYDYIQREELEDDLFNLLADDRRAVVTLLGRGGIGKTSLALRVIPRLYKIKRFDAVIWFSSRDIDLQSGGAKLVQADVISDKDIAKYYSKLVLSEDQLKDKMFETIDFFQSQLTKSDIGPCLFVFDNFETTSNPIEVFKQIDTYIRVPNKILITTRLRDFIGDYPITVHGMNENEAEALIRLTSGKLGVESLLTKKLIEEIIKVSAGHPYIIKIMLGDLVKKGMKGNLPKIIAGSDEVLTALFERTYAALNPCSQRVFLTLASWNSAVPRLALEAILMVSIEDPLEVEKSVDNLVQYSMVEELKAEDGYYYISLPYVALAFGEKKVKVSPLKSVISRDIRLLQKFGPAKLEDKKISLERNFTIFLTDLNNHLSDFENHKDIIDRICWSYNEGRLLVARLLTEAKISKFIQTAKDYVMLYIENETVALKKLNGWKMLAEISRELKEPLDEVHSLIEISQITNVEFYELSNTANKINHMFSTKQLVLDDQSTKTELLSGFFDVMWKSKNNADAIDLSRMAWLALHMKKMTEADELIKDGLKLEPNNTHCIRLKARIERDLVK
jgi:hypothetical protein